MVASAVAYRYARALVDIVLEPGSSLKPEDTVAQLHLIEETLASSEELRTALLTPAIQTSRKHAVVARLLEKLGGSPLIRNFLYVIIDHRRIGIFSEVREAFENVLDERRGIVRAEIVSAAPLEPQRSAGLESELSRLTGKRMRLRFEVDGNLLGGVLARIGSTVYDGSVRGQLTELRRRLTEQTAE